MTAVRTERLSIQPELQEICGDGRILLPLSFRLFLRESGVYVGQLLLLSVSPEKKTARIAFVTEEKFRRQGLMSEAVGACFRILSELGLCIYYISAVIPSENEAAAAFLRKNGFRKCRSGIFALWEKEKPPTVWHILFTCLGMCIGGFFGSLVLGNHARGMLAGMAIGFFLGILLNRGEKAKRKKAYGTQFFR